MFELERSMRKKFIKEVSGKTRSTGNSGKAGKNGGIKKQYLKSDTGCKVTFRLPKKAAPAAQRVVIAGDFNNWDQEYTEMKRLKNGDFTITLKLEKGREYHYRYLIDNSRWENDWYADKYLPNPFGGDDSVVVV